MSLEKRQIKEALRNCHVLIVEDDIPLASRIAEIFKEYTITSPETAHSMELARKIVADSQGRFDLAIMDVMLPSTDEDFREIQEYEKILDRVRNEITKTGTGSLGDEAKRTLFDARYERAQALRQIEDRTNQEGGIELVREWRNSRQLFPILFLTAVGNDAMVQRGRLTAGEYLDWVVKPAPSDLILEKCVNLLKRTTSIRR